MHKRMLHGGRFSRVLLWPALVSIVLTAGSESVRAGELSAQQIVDKVLDNNAFGFQNAVARVTLKLVSKRGRERLRRIEIRSLAKDGKKKTLVRFHSPADVAGTGFLVIENDDRDDDQFLYLPALGKVKRISSSQRNERFMGTDLTYADLESRNLRKANLKKLADAEVGGNPAFVIEATPKDGADSQYAKTVSWIHKMSFVPLKVEFYDKKGQRFKVLVSRRLEKRDGHWVVIESTVTNEQANTKTHMLVDDISFRIRVHDSELTQRALADG